MPANLSNVDALLKEFYLDSARDALNNEVPTLRKMQRSERSWSGRRVIFPLSTARTSGVGARAENTDLPTAANHTWNEVRISAVYNYVRVEVTGQAMRASKNAFLDALQSELSQGLKSSKNDISRQLWGVGDGRMAQVGSSGASSTSISVFNRFAEPGQNGARYVAANQVLDGGTVASPTTDFSSQTVISVSVSRDPATTTDTITISDSTVSVTASTTFIFNRGAGGTGVELAGLRGLIDEFSQSNIWDNQAYMGSAVQNINRASVALFNANILENSGVERIIDPLLLQQAVDEVDIESGMEVNQLVGRHEVVRALFENQIADRRYNTDVLNIADRSKLSFMGIPIEVDRHAPHNELFGWNSDALQFYVLQDWEWSEETGAILRPVSNRDSFEAFLRHYGNIGIELPRATFAIRDIKVDF